MSDRREQARDFIWFSDVINHNFWGQSYWFTVQSMKLIFWQDKNIVIKYSDGDQCPDSSLTRSTTITLVCRPGLSGTNYWHVTDICWYRGDKWSTQSPLWIIWWLFTSYYLVYISSLLFEANRRRWLCHQWWRFESPFWSKIFKIKWFDVSSKYLLCFYRNLQIYLCRLKLLCTTSP